MSVFNAPVHGSVVAPSSLLPEVRAQLSALGYSWPLGLDSAPLAAALLRDLLAVSDAFELLRGRLVGAEAATPNAVDVVQPLRLEHSRLLRANAAVSGPYGCWRCFRYFAPAVLRQATHFVFLPSFSRSAAARRGHSRRRGGCACVCRGGVCGCAC